MSYLISNVDQDFSTLQDAIDYIEANKDEIRLVYGNAFIHKDGEDLGRAVEFERDEDGELSHYFPYGEQLVYADITPGERAYFFSPDGSINEYRHLLEDDYSYQMSIDILHLIDLGDYDDAVQLILENGLDPEEFGFNAGGFYIPDLEIRIHELLGAGMYDEAYEQITEYGLNPEDFGLDDLGNVIRDYEDDGDDY